MAQKQNLTFASYAMPAGNNTNLKYDARAMGPNPQGSWGIRLDDPEGALGIGPAKGKSWYEQMWGE